MDNHSAKASVSGAALGGGAASAAQRTDARALAELGAGQLTGTRAAARRWQGGLAGLTGVIAIFGLVEGREDVDTLATTWGIGYGVALAVGLALAVAGGLCAMRAAFGLPRVTRTENLKLRRADAAEARRSTRLLRTSIWTTLASIGLVAVALAIAWYAPNAKKPGISVREESGATSCGDVVRVLDGALVLKTADGEQQVDLTRATGLQAVASCPGAGG